MESAIVDAFRKLHRDRADRPLIYLPASSAVVTAADMAEGARTVGAAFDAADVSPRSLIAAAIGNRPAAVSAFLACRERGHPFLPLDGGTTAAEIGTVATQFGAAAVLMAAARPIRGFSRMATIAEGLTLAVADEDPGESRHEAAVLKMTSGSTGRPRATLTPELSLVTDSRSLMTAMGIGPDDIQIAAIPLSHAYGFGNLLVPLLLQGTRIVMREAFVPQRLPDDARRYGARVFPGVPFMFDHFAANPPQDGWPPSLTRLLTAGARIEPAVVESFRALFGMKIHSFYGTSETGVITFDDTEGAVADGMVGKPLAGVTVSIVPQDDPAAGRYGRVHVSGPSVIRGYADGVDAESFVDDGFLTSDLGTFDAEGRLCLSGRISSVVNVAGRKVHPEEVERVLRALDGVADTRVIGVADDRRGEQLVACLVMRTEQPSVTALRQFCSARLASHKIPRAFVFLDRIPLTERGKTDRIELESIVMATLKATAGML